MVGCVAFLSVLTDRAGRNERTLTLTSDIRKDLSYLGLLSGEYEIAHGGDLHARWSDTLTRLEAEVAALPRLEGMTAVLYARVADDIPTLKGLGSDLEALHASGRDGEATDATTLARRDLLLSRTLVVVADSLGRGYGRRDQAFAGTGR